MGRRKKQKDQPVTEATTAPAGEQANGADHTERPLVLDLAAKTLRGDVRDAVLSEFKGIPKPWQQMNEWEQQRLIQRAEHIAHEVVGRAVEIAAAEGVASLIGRVVKFSATDKGLKLEFNVALSEENLVKLAKHTGAAVLALIEPSRYQGQRRTAETDVVGDLAMPKARADEALLDKVGRGNGEPAPAVDPVPAEPPTAEMAPVDVSDVPFALGEAEPVDVGEQDMRPRHLQQREADGHYRGLDSDMPAPPAMP